MPSTTAKPKPRPKTPEGRLDGILARLVASGDPRIAEWARKFQAGDRTPAAPERKPSGRTKAR